MSKPQIMSISVSTVASRIHDSRGLHDRQGFRRGLGDGYGDIYKTWIFRIPRSSYGTINAIRVGHCAVYMISIVARIASWIWLGHCYSFRAPGAVSVMTRCDPKGSYLGGRRFPQERTYRTQHTDVLF